MFANLKSRKIIRNILMGMLVINFLFLLVALTDLIEPNPLTDYRLILGISFIIIAGMARTVCKNCDEETTGEIEN